MLIYIFIIFISQIKYNKSIYCSPGKYFSSESSSSCSTCTSGSYCLGGTDAIQISCPAGKYGESTGLSSVYCDGKCSSGHYCLEGSISKNQFICEAGYYCPEGTEYKSQYKCPISYYCPEGSSIFSLKCPQGRFGSNEGLTNSDCDGICSKGYYCPTGSTSATQFPCPIGKFGNITGLYDALCTGDCYEKYYCNYGSTSPTQSLCSVGKYCPTGTTSEIDCPAGYWCEAGSYEFSIRCQLGSYCPTATTSQILCPGGTYGGDFGLFESTCSVFYFKCIIFYLGSMLCRQLLYRRQHFP